MAETDLHREIMIALIKTLQRYFAQDPMVYVSGNLLVFYVPGDRRRHLSPDVFVVKGVPNRPRDNYLIWEEGQPPHLVIELTSSSTRDEDVEDKFWLYRDELKVREYFLFDPHEDYLEPPFQGYRLEQGQYVPIAAVEGRLPSEVLGLHLGRQGAVLRLYNPAEGRWLPTPEELLAETEAARQREQAARQQAEAELERLRRELDELRRRPTPEA
jgi:Uma2 family endonuclease